jgi:hypothetical protein
MDSKYLSPIKDFVKGNFFRFMKYYLYFVILFTIIFYILEKIIYTTNNNNVLIETKIFLYLVLVFIFVIVNDILKVPVESINKILYIMLFTLLIIYMNNYLLEKYYHLTDRSYDKFMITILCSFILYGIIMLFIYFCLYRNKKSVALDIFNSFNFGITKNLRFILFTLFYALWYFIINRHYSKEDTHLHDILKPTVLGSVLLFFLFILIIYIGYKGNIINKYQILNSFLSLFSIFIFLLLLCGYIFINNLKTICKENDSVKSIHEKEIVYVIIIASIITILWLSDSRNWKQKGSIIFIIVTLITFYMLFFYSVKYPSTGLLSFWLFIEWLIIIFKRKENIKNSLHFSFMIT